MNYHYLFVVTWQRLDGDQTELLVRSSGATNPLWLSLACEELRVFGVFETLTQHIKNLPVGLKELLQLIINRLTKEDESNKVQKVFTSLQLVVVLTVSSPLPQNFHCTRSGCSAYCLLTTPPGF